MRLLVALMFASLACVMVQASVPSQTGATSPIPTGVLTAEGLLTQSLPNPAVENKSSANKALPTAPEQYLQGTDFMGKFTGVPLNPTAHLQANLAEDKEYIAAILRAPLDLGDPTDCKHEDIVKDEQELRKIALRINHRRVSLLQQQHWIESATEGLKKIESEISSTTATARNLAEQLDALTAQRDDITNHVRRSILLKELDRTSSNFMRLKNARMKEEVSLQQKHNGFAVKNHQHNKVLKKLRIMRTKQGLALGKLPDPKPYRFQQVEQKAEAEAETENQESTEQETETETEGETESEEKDAE